MTWSLGDFHLRSPKIVIDRDVSFQYNDPGYRVIVSFVATDSEDPTKTTVITSTRYFPSYIPESFSVPSVVRELMLHEIDEFLQNEGERIRNPHPECKGAV